METLERIDIENYGTMEDNEVKVGEQIVSFTCESEDCGDYPYKYIVCVEVNGATAEGFAWQRDEWESAYHDGFEPAYEMACRNLGVSPKNI